MRTVAITGTMEIELDVIARIATEQLGMVPAEADGRTVPSLDPFEGYPVTAPDLDAAIADVIRATEKLDRDQHSRGEQAAMTGLFRAGKHLRTVVRQLKSITPKGKINV